MHSEARFPGSPVQPGSEVDARSSSAEERMLILIVAS